VTAQPEVVHETDVIQVESQVVTSETTPPSLSGHYAGIVTRVTGYVIDSSLILFLYALTIAVVGFVIALITRFQFQFTFPTQVGATVAFIGWGIVYMWYTLASFDRTPGMALLGLRIARGDGSHLGVFRCLVRVILAPLLAVLTLGLSEMGVVVGKRRRALHDVVAGSVVVYDWDARPSRGVMQMRRTTATITEVDPG
jgi:uncharacterized RDD family membrane protein YckC